MPIYRYTAWDDHAAQHNGVIAAENVHDARRKLVRLGLYPTSVTGPGIGAVAVLLRLLTGRRAS